jgi:hypothetical protein
MYVLVLESDATKKVFVHSAFIRTVSRLLQGKLDSGLTRKENKHGMPEEQLIMVLSNIATDIR